MTHENGARDVRVQHANTLDIARGRRTTTRANNTLEMQERHAVTHADTHDISSGRHVVTCANNTPTLCDNFCMVQGSTVLNMI